MKGEVALAQQGLQLISCHRLMPGTGLARDAPRLLRFIFTRIFPHIFFLLRIIISKNIHTPAESGHNLAWLATYEETAEEHGVYYEGEKAIPSSKDSYDEDKQRDLWEVCLRMLCIRSRTPSHKLFTGVSEDGGEEW